jgi:hypothetical protein
MNEQIVAWTGFALVLLFCLPFSGTRKLVLELSGWALRLALLALLAGGALLWFRPDLLPEEVVSALDRFPAVRDFLPSPGSEAFGPAASALVAAVFLPLLAVLDATRKLSGARFRRLRRLADAARREPAPAPVEYTIPQPRPLGRPVAGMRRSDRRAAAETMGQVGSRKPFRVADQAP